MVKLASQSAPPFLANPTLPVNLTLGCVAVGGNNNRSRYLVSFAHRSRSRKVRRRGKIDIEMGRNSGRNLSAHMR